MNDLKTEGLKFTSIPTVPYYDKSIIKSQSIFLKNGQNVAGTQNSDPKHNLKPDPNKKYADIIVISPGSRYLRFGLASEAEPHEEAHALARKVLIDYNPLKNMCFSNESLASKDNHSYSEGVVFCKYDYLRDLKSTVEELKTVVDKKLIAHKLTPSFDSQKVINTHNQNFVPETLPDYNDPSETDWTKEDGKVCLVGNEALKLETFNVSSEKLHEEGSQYIWKIFYPLQHGCPNVCSNVSMRSCIDDMIFIWKELIKNKLNIPEKSFPEYFVTLVIPDIFNRQFVTDTITALISDLKFRAVTFIQESTAATFAAGAANACIVNIGAQKTTVACIDEGVCVPDSRLNMKYGGDDITRFFLEVLKLSHFPYRNINIEKCVSDWMLIEKLKEKYCTLSEMDLSLDTATFYSFHPDVPTMQYTVKYYYESILAPLLLFYPYYIDFRSKLEFLALRENYLDYTVDDDYSTSCLSRRQLAAILKYNYGSYLAPYRERKHAKFGQTPTEAHERVRNSTTSSKKRRVLKSEDTKNRYYAGSDKNSDKGSDRGSIKIQDADSNKKLDVDSNKVRDVERNSNKKIEKTLGKVNDGKWIDDSGADASDTCADVSDAYIDHSECNSVCTESKRSKLVYDDTLEKNVQAKNGSSNLSRSALDKEFDVAQELEFYMKNKRAINDLLKMSLPIDGAIIESIKNYFNSLPDTRTRDLEPYLKKTLGSIILVGGGSIIKGLPKFLENRVSSMAYVLLENSNKKDVAQKIQCRVIHDSREINPRHSTWKGASVFSKIESVNETWITASEWSAGGMQKVLHKIVVTWN